MRRWSRRLALALVALVVLAAVPILWIEGVCAAGRDGIVRARAPLVADPGYARRESDSYLSFPEWHIVYAYEDLAGVLRDGGRPSRFAYWRQIAGFWRSLCRLMHVATARGPVGGDTRIMLYTIGWSFTAELAIKGLYEETVGRLFEWWRGPSLTAEDAFVAADATAYARFLHQTPWYAYPFGGRLDAFWRETPWSGPHLARKLERRAVVSGEYGVKAVYGALIGWASATALGEADLEIHTVVAGLQPADLAAAPAIRVVRHLGGGRTLIRTPRYQVYTDLLVGLARRGVRVLEIAGNDRILMTVLLPAGPVPTPAGATELFVVPVQSGPARRRLGLDAEVEHLTETIRALEASGAVIEHVYDY